MWQNTEAKACNSITRVYFSLSFTYVKIVVIEGSGEQSDGGIGIVIWERGGEKKEKGGPNEFLGFFFLGGGLSLLPFLKANSCSWLESKWFLPPASSLLGPVGCHSAPHCHLSLFLLWCLCYVGVICMVTLGGELRLEVKAGVSSGCEGHSQKEVSLSSLIHSGVMNGPCHPSTAPHSLFLHITTVPLCSDTVVKCNLGDRG